MAFRIPWDETKPLGTYPADVIDDEIRNVKVSVSERISGVIPGWDDDDEDPKEFPGWILKKAVTQTLPAGSVIPVVFEAVERESQDFVGLPPITIVTVPPGLGGLYSIGASVLFSTVFIAPFTMTITRNGFAVGVERKPNNTGHTFEINRSIILEVGDQLRTEMFFSTGVDQTIDFPETHFWGVRLGG